MSGMEETKIHKKNCKTSRKITTRKTQKEIGRITLGWILEDNFEDQRWMELGHDRIQWRALVGAATKHYVNRVLYPANMAKNQNSLLTLYVKIAVFCDSNAL
jgi:hypothetical protein